MASKTEDEKLTAAPTVKAEAAAPVLPVVKPAAVVEPAPIAASAPVVAPAKAVEPVTAKVAKPEGKAKPVKIVVAKKAKAAAAKVAVVARMAAKPVVTKISPSASKKTSAVKAAPAASSPARKAKLAAPAPVFTKLIAAEKVKTMFADINDRAKAALEKTAKAGEEFTEFTKGNMEALAVSAKTAAKGAETIGQEMAEYGKKSFETASATMKSLAGVKTPTEMFQIQSDYAKSAFDGAVAEASKLSEAWLKLAGDVFQPLSSRYALAAEKIKAATL